ncbi:MAG: hypothetical protein ACR2HV_05750 [Acidimicrobiales bacterium]
MIESRPEASGGPPAAPPEASSPSPADGEVPEHVRSLFQVVGSVVAPTTLLTALLFYFGWAYTAKYFAYFGLDWSLIRLTTQDYLTSSVVALFEPMAASFSAGLLIAWVHTRLKARFFAGPDSRRHLQLAARASSLCGLVLFGIGLAGIFVVRREVGISLWFPLSLGAGAVLLAYGSRLQARAGRSAGAMTGVRSTGLLEVTAAFFVVALSLFWAATNYAADLGAEQARGVEGRLPSAPEAILYSKEPLYLGAPGVRETSCGEAAGGYRFRYQGLRLMIQSGGHYFFLPAAWSRADGVAVVVPESDSVRLQFAVTPPRGGQASASAGIICPSPQPPP